MSSRVVFALSIAALAIATGCSQPPKPAATPAEAALDDVDPSSDPSFVPPDESGVTFVDPPTRQKTLGEKTERNEKARNLPSPNAHQGSRGQVHHAE